MKKSNFYKNYSKMWVYVKPYWFRALMAIIITIPIGAMDAVIAWALKPYMDIVMVEKGASYTAYIPLLIILFTFIQSVFNYSATYLNTWVGQKVSMGLKVDLFKKLLHYHAGFFDKQNSGQIVYRFNSDVDTSCNGLLSNLKLFTTRLFSSLSLIGVLFYNSWELAIVAVVVFTYPMSELLCHSKQTVPSMAVFLFCSISMCFKIVAWLCYTVCKLCFVLDFIISFYVFGKARKCFLSVSQQMLASLFCFYMG